MERWLISGCEPPKVACIRNRDASSGDISGVGGVPATCSTTSAGNGCPGIGVKHLEVEGPGYGRINGSRQLRTRIELRRNRNAIRERRGSIDETGAGEHHRGGTDVDLVGRRIQQHRDRVQYRHVHNCVDGWIVYAGGLHHHHIRTRHNRRRRIDPLAVDGADLRVSARHAIHRPDERCILRTGDSRRDGDGVIDSNACFCRLQFDHYLARLNQRIDALGGC